MSYEITGQPMDGGYITQAEINLIDQLPFGDCVVFDVGANRGDFTQAVKERRPHARIFAFEPQVDLWPAFRERFGYAVPLQGALGAERGRMEFFTDGTGSQLATFHPRTETLPMIAAHSLGVVEVDTVDGMCAALGIGHLDLLKIDTEGHEYQVLLGAHRMLDHISFILWEETTGVTPFPGSGSTEDVMQLLNGRFELGDLLDDGWHELVVPSPGRDVRFLGARRHGWA